MIKVIRCASMLLAFSINVVGAEPLSSEQRSVTEFIKKMYSYGADTFEFGRFNGHYDAEKFCALMEDFFQKQILTPLIKNQGCDPADVLIRYPGAGSEELGYNAKPGQLPKPKLSTPKIEGDKASVSATSEFGKRSFF